MHMIELILR